MSASLVGSEMCIRDSLPHRGCSVGSSAERSPRNAGSRGASPPPLEPASVSYTHLTLPTICSV
eukprot:4489926-Alexandrium_andersonii.AAC.1